MGFLLQNNLTSYVQSVSILLHYPLSTVSALLEEENTGIMPPQGSSDDVDAYFPGIQQTSTEGSRIPNKLWDNN